MRKFERQKDVKKKRRYYLAAVFVLVVAVYILCSQLFTFSFDADTSGAGASNSNMSGAVGTTDSNTKSICLDPGHGGDGDPGAVNGDVIERDINLAVAKKVGTLLAGGNYKIYLTREGDDAVGENKDRAAFCNEKNADILISIHHNDYADSEIDYAMALYYKDTDHILATIMLDTVSDSLGVTSNGLESFDDNVLIKSEMPAVLIEPFFVSSDYEKNQIDYGNRLDEEAASIVKGIEAYFKDNK